MDRAEIFIHGVGHFHPENVIDNTFLASLEIGCDEQWTLERVGIKSRRTVLSLDYLRETKNAQPLQAAQASSYTNAQTGAKAAKMALLRAGIEAKDIGMVIAGGCSPQYTIPAEACMIAAELGITAPSFDLNSACSSFAVQLHYLRSMRPEMLPDYILVVNAENNTRTVDYSDRRNAVLWGDATTATVISPRIRSRFSVSTSLVESDPSGWDKVTIKTGRHFAQQGSAVQSFAIRKSLAMLNLLRSHAKAAQSDLYLIAHQANLLMLENVVKRGEINPERHLCNVDDYGNCGAAGAPSVLSQNWEKFVKGDEIALIVVGSGLTWGGLLISVGEK